MKAASRFVLEMQTVSLKQSGKSWTILILQLASARLDGSAFSNSAIIGKCSKATCAFTGMLYLTDLSEKAGARWVTKKQSQSKVGAAKSKLNLSSTMLESQPDLSSAGL